MVAWWVIPAIVGGAKAAGGLLQNQQLASSTTLTAQNPRWNAQQQELFNQLFNLTSNAAQGPSPSAPAMSVPQTGQESTYFDLVQQLAQSKAASGQPLYDVGPEWVNNYFQNSVMPEYVKQYQEITQPAINKAYAGNFYSSARQQAQTKAATDLATQLASEKAKLQYGEVQNARTAMDTAFTQQNQVVTQQQQAASLDRSIQEQKVMENLQRYLMGEEVDGQYNPMYNPSVAMAMSLLGLDPYVYSQVSTSEQNGPGALSAMLSGFGTGFGQGAMAGGGS